MRLWRIGYWTVCLSAFATALVALTSVYEFADTTLGPIAALIGAFLPGLPRWLVGRISPALSERWSYALVALGFVILGGASALVILWLGWPTSWLPWERASCSCPLALAM